MTELSIERRFCDLSMAIALNDRTDALRIAASFSPDLLERFKREYSGQKEQLETWVEPVRQAIFTRLVETLELAIESAVELAKQKRVVPTNKVFDIPEKLAKCPYCNAKLSAQATGWTEEADGSWSADEIDLNCDAMPDFDSEEWNEWDANHSQMPYVYWLPVETTVKYWINDRYRFDVEVES